MRVTSTRPVEYPTKRLAFMLGVIKEHSPRPLRRAVLKRVLAGSRFAMRGTDVQCTACGTAASRYARGYCVACIAAPRQRLIALFLRSDLLLERAARARILHFAPEPGLIQMLSGMPNVDYVPGDLVPDKGHEQVNATAIRLVPGFDGIITSHVLEHIRDDAKAIEEMFRVLRPGGWALVIVPVREALAATYEDAAITSRWDRHRHYGQHDHVRVYGQDFFDRLRNAGFSVDVRRYAEELPPEDVRRYGLRTSDVICLCRRPEGGDRLGVRDDCLPRISGLD